MRCLVRVTGRRQWRHLTKSMKGLVRSPRPEPLEAYFERTQATLLDLALRGATPWKLVTIVHHPGHARRQIGQVERRLLNGVAAWQVPLVFGSNKGMGQMRNMGPGTHCKAVVADDAAKVNHPGIPPIQASRSILMPACRAKADGLGRPQTDGLIRERASIPSLTVQRVPGVDHRFPPPPGPVLLDRNMTDRA